MDNLGLDSPVDRPKEFQSRTSDVFGHNQSNSHSGSNEMDNSNEYMKVRTYIYADDEDLLKQVFPPEWHQTRASILSKSEPARIEEEEEPLQMELPYFDLQVDGLFNIKDLIQTVVRDTNVTLTRFKLNSEDISNYEVYAAYKKRPKLGLPKTGLPSIDSNVHIKTTGLKKSDMNSYMFTLCFNTDCISAEESHKGDYLDLANGMNDSAQDTQPQEQIRNVTPTDMSNRFEDKKDQQQDGSFLRSTYQSQTHASHSTTNSELQTLQMANSSESRGSITKKQKKRRDHQQDGQSCCQSSCSIF